MDKFLETFFFAAPCFLGDGVFLFGGDFEVFFGGLSFFSLVKGILSLDSRSVTSIGVFLKDSGIGEGYRAKRLDSKDSRRIDS